MRVFSRYELHSKKIRLSSKINEVVSIFNVELLDISINGVKVKSDFLLKEGSYTFLIGTRVVEFHLTPVWYEHTGMNEFTIAGYRILFNDSNSYQYWCLFNQAAHNVKKEKEQRSDKLTFHMPTN